MEQLQIIRQVVAAVHAPQHVMHVPAAFQRQRLPAPRTASLLPLPQAPHDLSPSLGVPLLALPACLPIRFPRRVIRMSVVPHLDVSADPGLARPAQGHPPRRFALRARHLTGEDPGPRAYAGEVASLQPPASLAAVPPTRPAPEQSKDFVVHISKRALAVGMAVIQRPTTNLGG